MPENENTGFDAWGTPSEEEDVMIDNGTSQERQEQGTGGGNEHNDIDPNTDQKIDANSNENQVDENEFDSNTFLESFKTKNPEASEEDIDKAVKEAEEKFYTATGDVFNTNEETGTQSSPSRNYIDNLKLAAGEEFDELKYSDISTPEEFQEAYKEIVNNRVEKQVEERVKLNQTYSSLNEETKAVMDIMTNQGFQGLQKFLQPNSKIAELKTLPQDELLVESLKSIKNSDGSRVYTDEEVAQKISRMEDDEKNLEYKGIIAKLNNTEAEQRRQLAQMVNNEAEKRKNLTLVEKTQMAEKLEAVGNKMTEYFGIKIDPSFNKQVAHTYRTGGFDHLLKDPNFLYKAILNDKIGERAFRKYGKAKFEEGAGRKNRIDHNVDGLPDTSISGGGTGSASQKGFGGWGT